jgi:hypothetical protein
MRGLILLTSILMLISSIAAVPDEAWSSTFGGKSSDPGGSVRQTADGGYILTGMTYSYGSGKGDLFLVKADSKGHEEWNRTFGVPSFDIGRSVLQTPDGGYMAAGATKSYGTGNSDIWLVRTDVEGRELWNRTFGGKGADEATSLIETRDGGYALAGPTESFRSGRSQVWMIRTDDEGRELWNRTFWSQGSAHCWSIIQAEDGGYLLAGSADSEGGSAKGNSSDLAVESNQDVRLVKVDAKGEPQWQQSFGGPQMDEARSAVQARDGSFMLTGIANARLFDDNPSSRLLLARISANGTILWQKAAKSPGREEGYAILESEDGGYLVAGYST